MKITYKQQLEVLLDMQADGYNVCTCEQCGDIILYNEQMTEAEYITCPHCKEEMESSDNPDFYVEGLAIMED